MSMSLEDAVISRILHDGSPQKALNLGVNRSWFLETGCRLVWEAIVDHATHPATRNKCPSPARVNKLVPNYVIETCPEETAEELLKDLSESRAKALIQSGIVALDEHLRLHDLDKAITHLNALVRDLGENLLRPSHQSCDLVDAIPTFMENIDRVSAGGGLVGMPYPWEPLNCTGGMEPGTLTIVYAPAKNGKTWIGLEIGCIHPFEVANARVLVVSNEMPVRQIWRRILARICRLDYSDVVQGSLPLDARDESFDMLTQMQEDQLLSMRQEMAHSYRDIRVCRPSLSEGGGVNAVKNEIDRFKPDVVLVDGLYLMADDRQGGKRDIGHKSIEGITQDLKHLASECNIPVVATTQSNREGVKKSPAKMTNADFDDYGDVGFSLGPVRDADFVIRLQKIRDYTNGNDRILVTLPALRDGTSDAFTINFKPVLSFDLDIVNITPEQLRMLNVEDDAEQEPPVRQQQRKSSRKKTPPAEQEFDLGGFDPFGG
tara:strand:+ start:3299 stop:4765 length:1467 start_codon:yes stop_codon:yes gene_type:complete